MDWAEFFLAFPTVRVLSLQDFTFEMVQNLMYRFGTMNDRASSLNTLEFDWGPRHYGGTGVRTWRVVDGYDAVDIVADLGRTLGFVAMLIARKLTLRMPDKLVDHIYGEDEYSPAFAQIARSWGYQVVTEQDDLFVSVRLVTK